jgi:predicted ATPase
LKQRYILDGPPGSGKSTVLFGLSDGDTDKSSLETMASKGYNCLHESVAQAHKILSDKGLKFDENQEFWLETIVNIDKEKFSSAEDGVNFYDRCFHHWKLFSQSSGIKLPEWYEEVNQSIRYDDPVFLVAPVKSIDLSDPSIHISRRFTWEQRLAMYEETKALYQDLNYRVIDVPMFLEGDINSNNQQRIELILNSI